MSQVDTSKLVGAAIVGAPDEGVATAKLVGAALLYPNSRVATTKLVACAIVEERAVAFSRHPAPILIGF